MEQLVFGEAPSRNAVEQFNAIKRAMKQLGALIDEEKPLTWAQGWLAELGHDEYNPVDMFLFSQYWLGHIASLLDYLREHLPENYQK